jgi:glycosyltransferase involved in cell wall biosynthesis
LRIGIDITKAITPTDGVGNYTLELLRSLATQLAQGDELYLYSLTQPHNAEAFAASFPDLPEGCHARPGGRPRDDQLDIFHATAFALPAGYRGAVLFTCYDLTFLTHAECHTRMNKIACLTGTLEAHLAGAHFAAISQATAEELTRQLGTATSRIQVTHLAAGPAFQLQDETEARDQLRRSFGLEGSFVLAVGTLEPRKNLRRLLNAYDGLPAALKASHPLVMAGGKGWLLDEDELARFASAKRLGHVSLPDLVALYNAATVFAYPSLAEGFGLPVIEAMACGAPVLTSNVSSLPEVAGDAARLVDPLDVEAIREALHALLEDSEARVELRRRGFERAASFSWERTARETLELYHQAVRGGSR